MDRFVLKRKSPSQDVPDMNWEEEIQYDPGKRKLIEDYHPNLKELVRRKYLVNGPCQPREFAFPYSSLGKKEEGSFLIGSMILEAGLNTVNRRTKHIVFVVSCSGTVAARRKLGTRLLL